VLIALVLAAAAEAPAQPVFRVGVDLVSVGVTVVDRKGTLIADLTRDDFRIVENGAPQEISHFTQGTSGDDGDGDVPLHLGLLFDTSGSMVEDLQMSRTAAVKFLNTLPRAEDITLVDFDTEVRVARYGQADFARLVERIRNRKPDGWTALYDALGVYLDGANGDTGQKTLVLYTDGGDTRSAMSFGDLVDLLKASDVTVYAIGFLEHQSSSTKSEQRMKLQQIAELTGGQAFFPMSVKQLDEIYAKILDEMKARYTLGYASTDARQDGAWREVEITLLRHDLKGARIRTRKGYFAPYSEAHKP
jgi:Ca-activated chloride channel family protein